MIPMRKKGVCVVYATLLIRATINPTSPPRLTHTNPDPHHHDNRNKIGLDENTLD